MIDTAGEKNCRPIQPSKKETKQGRARRILILMLLSRKKFTESWSKDSQKMPGCNTAAAGLVQTAC